MKLERDKVLHVVAGFVAGLAVLGLLAVAVRGMHHTGFVLQSVQSAMLLGAALAGVARELINVWSGGRFDPADMAATFIGGVAAAVLLAVAWGV
jgi:hypothetical protein